METYQIALQPDLEWTTPALEILDPHLPAGPARPTQEPANLIRPLKSARYALPRDGAVQMSHPRLIRFDGVWDGRSGRTALCGSRFRRRRIPNRGTPTHLWTTRVFSGTDAIPPRPISPAISVQRLGVVASAGTITIVGSGAVREDLPERG